MLDLTRDFQSLSFFRRKTATFAELLKKSKRPLILTHKGKPELVVQSAAAYQHLLDLATRQDAMEGIRQRSRRCSERAKAACSRSASKIQNRASHTIEQLA